MSFRKNSGDIDIFYVNQLENHDTSQHEKFAKLNRFFN